MSFYSPTITSDELYHFGIKGQRWGIRRYQNEDGTLTDAGKKRYVASSGRTKLRGIGYVSGSSVAKYVRKRNKALANVGEGAARVVQVSSKIGQIGQIAGLTGIGVAALASNTGAHYIKQFDIGEKYVSKLQTASNLALGSVAAKAIITGAFFGVANKLARGYAEAHRDVRKAEKNSKYSNSNASKNKTINEGQRKYNNR